jgi:hypothetical protein
MRFWPWIFAPMVSALAIMVLLVVLPSSYLDARPSDRTERLRRRLEGVFLIIAGIVLAIPGIPGPGIILVVLGLTFLMAPERGFAVPERHRRMVERINRLRAFFRRPPLRLHHP